jgi:hypothetical protein
MHGDSLAEPLHTKRLNFHLLQRAGASVRVSGVLTASPGAKQAVEIKGTEVELVSRLVMSRVLVQCVLSLCFACVCESLSFAPYHGLSICTLSTRDTHPARNAQHNAD